MVSAAPGTRHILIRGNLYTIEQLEFAVDAAWALSVAYARADEDNGGGGSVEWEEVNEAHESALRVWDQEALDELKGEAQAHNQVNDPDYDPDEDAANDAQAPDVDRKKADDTEGGSCD